MMNQTKNEALFPWLTGILTAETGLKMLAMLVALCGTMYTAIPALLRYLRIKRAAYALAKTTIDKTKLANIPYLLPQKTCMILF
jgi:hypothetical protein